MTFDERVTVLAPLGFTPRQTRFLVTAALHSGYCLRRQYLTFAGVRHGKNVRDFLEALVHRQLARRLRYQPNRGYIYHLHATGLYRALAQRDNRNRRPVSPAVIARKLMLLDAVPTTPDVEWYATEEDKVALFTREWGISLGDLPRRAYAPAGRQGPMATRYFMHQLPVYLTADRAVVHFVYLVTDDRGNGLAHFLQAACTGWLRAGRPSTGLSRPPGGRCRQRDGATCDGSSPRGSSSSAEICGPSRWPTSTASARAGRFSRARRWRRCTARGSPTAIACSTPARVSCLTGRCPWRSWSCRSCPRRTASSDRGRGCVEGASSLEGRWPRGRPLCWPLRTSIGRDERTDDATATSVGNEGGVPSGRARRRGGLRRVRGRDPGHRRGGSDPLDFAWA
jgi:hypothetical protein